MKILIIALAQLFINWNDFQSSHYSKSTNLRYRKKIWNSYSLSGRDFWSRIVFSLRLNGLTSANWVWVLDRSKLLRPVWHHHVSLDQCDSSKIWSIQAQHCFQWKLKIMAVGVDQIEYSPGFLLMKLIWLVTIISGNLRLFQGQDKITAGAKSELK